MSSFEDQQFAQSIYLQRSVTATSQSRDTFLNSPEFATMARQIEILSDRLNDMDEARGAMARRAQEYSDAIVRLEKRLADAYGEIAALERKLPPEPPAPPTAGETLAHCKRAIFPQER